MDVAIYGVRGSLPVPGRQTVRYGGNSVSVVVTLSDGTMLMLDAGTGLRGFGQHLLERNFEGELHLLLSHRHWDHLIGLPFFMPMYQPTTTLVLHPEAHGVPAWLWDGEHFPVREGDLASKRVLREWSKVTSTRIGSAVVRTVGLNHPGGATGYRIEDEDGSSLAYLTDNELNPPGAVTSTPEQLAAFAAGVEMMIHDAQYLGEDMEQKRGWGHSTIDDVLKLARLAQPQLLLMFHHDPSRSDQRLDELGGYSADWLERFSVPTRVQMARETSRYRLSKGKVTQLEDFAEWC